MALKQVNVSLPEKLFNASVVYSEEYGYRNLQEFIVDIIRRKVLLESSERYRRIEEDMKSEVNVKKFKTQKEAVEYLKNL